MKSVAEYTTKYGSIDEEIKRRYGCSDDSGFYYLEGHPGWRDLRDDLYYCREVRNYLEHGRKIGGKHPFTGVSDEMYAFLESVEEKIREPKTAGRVMVRMQKVYTCHLEDGVREAMQTMKDRHFTHVPIVDESGRVIGIFSENTLLTYLMEDKIVLIDETTVFADLEKYLHRNSQDDEQYDFIPKDMMLPLIEDKFIDAVKGGNRMGMLFVTENGAEDEKPLGIITAWDVSGNYVVA